jgi:hypothetical protein
MNWRALLTLSLSVIVNFFLLLTFYVALLALSSLLLPPPLAFLNRILLYVYVFVAMAPAWWVWMWLSRNILNQLSPEWKPNWDLIVKRLTGKF